MNGMIVQDNKQDDAHAQTLKIDYYSNAVQKSSVYKMLFEIESHSFCLI